MYVQTAAITSQAAFTDSPRWSARTANPAAPPVEMAAQRRIERGLFMGTQNVAWCLRRHPWCGAPGFADPGRRAEGFQPGGGWGGVCSWVHRMWPGVSDGTPGAVPRSSPTLVAAPRGSRGRVGAAWSRRAGGVGHPRAMREPVGPFGAPRLVARPAL